MDPSSDRTALVLPGGGARAAYQVGFLDEIARRDPTLRIPILSGVSSGAINTAFLAADAEGEGFARRVECLVELWEGLRTEQVMNVGLPSLAKNVVLWGLRLLSGGSRVPEARGLVDCTPLSELLQSHLGRCDRPIRGIQENLDAGRIRAVTLATTCFSTAESVTWVQGDPLPKSWRREGRIPLSSQLTVDHVMASSALPVFFPAVQLNGTWHGDGGIHLPTPLSASIHLGAERILVLSNHSVEGDGSAGTASGTSEAKPNGTKIRTGRDYPPPAEIAGALMSALFMDRLGDDVRRIERVNELLEEGCRSRKGLRPIAVRVQRPSRSLSEMALDYEHLLPRAFRFMTRGLGTRKGRSGSFLSMILFQPDYLRALLELGREDAIAEGEDVLDFLSDGGNA